MHGLNGYKEVIETVSWGLEQLGHQVSYAVNKTCDRYDQYNLWRAGYGYCSAQAAPRQHHHLQL